MSEIIFVVVEEAAAGGYTARALGMSIFTEADTVAQLHDEIRDAVRCHFEEDQAPKWSACTSFSKNSLRYN